MSSAMFPATTVDQFPSSLHDYLSSADAGTFVFPRAEEMIAPPLTELSSKQERIVKFAYFNFWLATLRVYYINAAWVTTWERIDRFEAGDMYADACRLINARYENAERELYIHYGHDYSGPIAR